MKHVWETKQFHAYIKENYIDKLQRTFKSPGPLYNHDKNKILLAFPNSVRIA
jgi:hypothetical protein